MTSSTHAEVRALPAQAISADVLLEKYAKGDEQHASTTCAGASRARSPQVEPEDRRAHWEARFLQALRGRLHPRRAHQLGRRHRAARPR